MSLTNQQRTKILNTITGANVRVLAMSTRILDKLHLKQYLPPAVFDL